MSMEHLQYTRDGVTETISLMDGEGVIDLFTEITGSDPLAIEPDQDVYYLQGTMRYEWSAVRVFMGSAADMSFASVSVSAPEVGGVPVRTVEGISVGSTREDAIAAGARGGYDSDDDGVPENLLIGRQEVPGTQSLVSEGVGSLFVSLDLEGDIVSRMSPGNDFSDI